MEKSDSSVLLEILIEQWFLTDVEIRMSQIRDINEHGAKFFAEFLVDYILGKEDRIDIDKDFVIERLTSFLIREAVSVN